MFQIKRGDWLSRISFMQVVTTNSMSTTVRNEDGLEWNIGNAIVAQECYSTHFSEEVTLSKTQLAEKLVEARDAIIIVNFYKQPTAADIVEKMVIFSGEQKLSKKDAESMLKGEERTMIGYVVGTEPILGRSMVIDVELEKIISPTKTGENYDKRLRQVDHRSLNWLIYKNVKYTLK